jgi:hypothetical protein
MDYENDIVPLVRTIFRTSVVLLRCPFVPEIMHGRAPDVFLHQ